MQLVIESWFNAKLADHLHVFNKEFENIELKLIEAEAEAQATACAVTEPITQPIMPKSGLFLADHLQYGCEQGIYIIELKSSFLSTHVAVRLI